ncbi:response regulator [Hufsiella ginkgonis]|uniref:Response regulator n=1 Tax=Hufsiella ginkgonis TaxID=2695274 RepID=A0A7K1XZE4_9SPHI|nr:response regulator [Hufsiella ginkgonis]MXV16333.1 response regulator [Hufsiella ginkgonis]
MKRVLVCDDDITISEVVALVLADSDWEVYTLHDCNNMIDKIRDTKPSVIFMDNKIPNDGGIVATQSIKRHPSYQQIPVIYFTSDNDIDELAKKAGADYVLQKPFMITQLEAVVNLAFKSWKENRLPGQ